MPVLTERVCRTIGRYRLLSPGARVLVAASGGADSTALVCLLNELAPRLGVALAGLAHFNHSMRGAASDEDEACCREAADRLGLPFEAARADVRAAARQLKTSVEDAGRRLRYAFLEEARERLDASHVAVGHTMDDQAETLLLNLLRGAGTRGLGGMRPARAAIVRPLIECSHRELVAWLDERGISYREDESNRDTTFARNRLRHQVLPAIDRAFPGTVAALARAADLARADADYLEELAAERLSGVARCDAGRTILDAEAIRLMPQAVARRVARLALLRASGGGFVAAADVERLLGMAAGASGGRVQLPGLDATRRGSDLVLRPRIGRGADEDDDFSSPSGIVFRSALSIPGEVSVGDGRTLSSDVRHDTVPRSWDSTTDESTAVVDAGRFTSLAVRFRRAGDRFRPLGMTGRKTLHDFFVDRKVPRAVRRRVPIVVDELDRIVWVAGHAVSEDFRVSEATRAVVILKLRGERV